MAVQEAIDLIKTACTKWNLGYDQDAKQRLDFRDGGETDCSALVILCCEKAGLLPGNNIRKSVGATYTGNMRVNFCSRGWENLPNLPVSKLRPGDVLLRDNHHTAMYIGDGQVAYASANEHGDSFGGVPGDQTGRETRVAHYYNEPPWQRVLRFHGAAHPTPPGQLVVDGVVGPGSAGKLRAVLGLPGAGVIDKAAFTALQAHVGAPYHDGVASNQNSAAIAAHWPALESFTVGSGGSASVKALQERLGVTADGELGEMTARALQTRLNTGRL
jgi:peptidoglycan hydrolase-like protein with peptidoglycan-binding domain